MRSKLISVKVLLMLIVLSIFVPVAATETAKEWLEKGDELYVFEKYEEAIECYDEALKIDPSHVEAWNNKGNALYKLGRYKEAIECFDEALGINRNLAGAWYNKGLALYKLRRYEEAIECFDETLRIIPNHDGAWYNKGLALYKLGRFEEAKKCFDEVSRINPRFIPPPILTPTPTSPGFEAIFAIAGLLVMLLFKRQRQSK